MMIPSKPVLKTVGEDDLVDNGDISVKTKNINNKVVSIATIKPDFELGDVLDYLKTGIACIIEDEVTSRFVQEELKGWNLMTRNKKSFDFKNWRITCMWIFGCSVRYCMLFPARLVVGLFGVGLDYDYLCFIPTIFSYIFWFCPVLL